MVFGVQYSPGLLLMKSSQECNATVSNLMAQASKETGGKEKESKFKIPLLLMDCASAFSLCHRLNSCRIVV